MKSEDIFFWPVKESSETITQKFDYLKLGGVLNAAFIYFLVCLTQVFYLIQVTPWYSYVYIFHIPVTYQQRFYISARKTITENQLPSLVTGQSLHPPYKQPRGKQLESVGALWPVNNSQNPLITLFRDMTAWSHWGLDAGWNSSNWFVFFFWRDTHISAAQSPSSLSVHSECRRRWVIES